MAVNTDKNKIREILERGVAQVIVREALEKKLLSGKKLRIYYGIDPTSPFLHLGHSIILKKLQAFQELGHEVILLIGDFTARIGDPTEKDAARKPLTEKQVKENMKTYKEQASKILDFNKVKLKYNSEWLSKLKFEDIIKLASDFTVQQMLDRDMFDKRMKTGKPISIHEFMYPLMQGYDSVAMDVDLEIAGTDQTFNMLAGRTLQKIYNNKDKDILTLKLLPGTDGRKMSKTFNNFIALSSEPNDMFGKIMSMQDNLIKEYFELCTQMTKNEIEKIMKQRPRNAKAKLAKEIVMMYHGEKQAEKAEQEFNKVHREKGVPTDRPVIETSKKPRNILDLIVDAKFASSKGDAKRKVLGRGVGLIRKGKERIIKDWQEKIKLEDKDVLRVGKRHFVSFMVK